MLFFRLHVYIFFLFSLFRTLFMSPAPLAHVLHYD